MTLTEWNRLTDYMNGIAGSTDAEQDAVMLELHSPDGDEPIRVTMLWKNSASDIEYNVTIQRSFWRRNR